MSLYFTCVYLCALQVAERAVHTFKADIDAAFRRIPIMPSAPASVVSSYPRPPPLLAPPCVSGHRQFAGVAYKLADEVWLSQHNSMPSGAVASVHAWDRVGAFFRTLGRRLFKLILFRYVDDFFAPDWEEVVENAMEVFARLVRACLGHSAIWESRSRLAPQVYQCGPHQTRSPSG